VLLYRIKNGYDYVATMGQEILQNLKNNDIHEKKVIMYLYMYARLPELK